MLYTKIKDFLEKKKKNKEELIKAILNMVTEEERKTFKEEELNYLSISELKELKEILEKS